VKYLLILLLASCTDDASCPVPEYVGTKDPLTKYERESSNAAKIRCGFLYGFGSCLKKLTRTGDRSWHSICGGA